MPEYDVMANFPDPWPGGWWRLRDIVDYELAAALAFLDYAAGRKTDLLLNSYRMNRDAVERGWADALASRGYTTVPVNPKAAVDDHQFFASVRDIQPRPDAAALFVPQPSVKNRSKIPQGIININNELIHRNVVYSILRYSRLTNRFLLDIVQRLFVLPTEP